MAFDTYAEAIPLDVIDRQIERCAAIDAAYPKDVDRCARQTVDRAVCPCMRCEDAICNTLTDLVAEEMLGR